MRAKKIIHSDVLYTWLACHVHCTFWAPFANPVPPHIRIFGGRFKSGLPVYELSGKFRSGGGGGGGGGGDMTTQSLCDNTSSHLVYSLLRNNWHPIFLRKQFVFFRKTIVFIFYFLHKSLWNALPIFIINFIFKLAQAFKSFRKGQISRKPP